MWNIKAVSVSVSMALLATRVFSGYDYQLPFITLITHEAAAETPMLKECYFLEV